MPPVPYRPFQPAVPAAGDNPAVEAVPEQLPVPGIDAVVATTLEARIVLIRNTIHKYSNSIIQRSILMTKMPSTEHADWRKWAHEIEEQAKRINWENYGWKEVACDALLYHCPDNVWRQKILTGRLDFNKAVDYGMRHLNAKVQSKELALAARPDTTPSEPIDRVVQRETFDCDRCTRNYAKGECTALGKYCVECWYKGHIPASRYCRGPRANPGENQQQDYSQRYSGRSEEARGDREYARPGEAGKFQNSPRRECDERCRASSRDLQPDRPELRPGTILPCPYFTLVFIISFYCIYCHLQSSAWNKGGHLVDRFVTASSSHLVPSSTLWCPLSTCLGPASILPPPFLKPVSYIHRQDGCPCHVQLWDLLIPILDKLQDEVLLRVFCPQLLFKAPWVVSVLTTHGLGPFHPLVWDTLIQAGLPVAVSKSLPLSVLVSLSPLDVPRLLVAVLMALAVFFPVAVPVSSLVVLFPGVVRAILVTGM